MYYLLYIKFKIKGEIMDSQLKRGILNICILQLLTTKDAYGYDIIKFLHHYLQRVQILLQGHAQSLIGEA